MAIALLPLYSGTPPNRNQPQADFNTNVATWVTYTTTFQPLFNTFATEANALAVEVDGYKSLALTYSNNAAASASAALTSQNLAASSADFKGAWSSLSGALSKPASVYHNGSFWALLNNLANVTTSEPSVTNTDWQFISGTRWQQTRTASFTVPVNSMQAILATGSTVDATLTASVPDGSFFAVANSPASTQTVRVLNAGYTIRSSNKTITSADNIVLAAGQTIYLRAISPTILEVLQNG